MVVMNWLGRLLQLPEHFIHSHGSTGGGMIQVPASDACWFPDQLYSLWYWHLAISNQCYFYHSQGTASEATLIALLAARTKKLEELSINGNTDGLIDKLVCYSSELVIPCLASLRIGAVTDVSKVGVTGSVNLWYHHLFVDHHTSIVLSQNLFSYHLLYF